MDIPKFVTFVRLNLLKSTNRPEPDGDFIYWQPLNLNDVNRVCHTELAGVA